MNEFIEIGTSEIKSLDNQTPKFCCILFMVVWLHACLQGTVPGDLAWNVAVHHGSYPGATGGLVYLTFR